jgi:para-aminobenzoate synthetase/4-amino-4-deoxychorismate lyase
LTPDRRYELFERHMARLERSSRALDFRLLLIEVRNSFEQRAQQLPAGYYRVRLELHPSGSFEITHTKIDQPDPEEVVRLVLSAKTVDSGDDLLKHKTTRRRLYDGEWRRWHDELGAGEVLFLNERGELTEGSRSNLFIEQQGRLLTPPLASGLLPGTLREELLEQGRAEEQVIKLDDLECAERIFVGNSVRGLQRGILVER